MKKIIPILLILILVGTAVFIRMRNRSEFLYAGTIEATEVDISSRLSSVIASYLVKEGDPVRAEQTLVKLDSQDMKLAAEIAQKNYDRAKNLFRNGSMPQENYDRVKYVRDDAALKLSWCAIPAPASGKVLYKYHEPGEWVTPGTKLLTLADLSDVWATIYVPEPMLAKLSVGMKLDGFSSESGMEKFEGRILVINDTAEFTPKNVQTREERTRLVFGIKVGFPNSQEKLKPGMTIEVKLPAL